MARPPIELRSEKFRADREKTWRELEGAVNRIEQMGPARLSRQALARLPRLYRATLSSLSVARSISLDRNVLDYLESLSARAFVCVYSNKRSPMQACWRYLRGGYPRAVRALAQPVLWSAAFLCIGLAVGFFVTVSDPERFYGFVSDDMAAGRDPAASRELLESTLYESNPKTEQLSAFSSMLFANNAKVGILCFALGFVAGLPVFFLLLYNGLIIGALAAVFHLRGLSLDLWGWLLPHGITELLAVVLCGAAGLSIGRAVVFPGRETRLESLAIHGRRAGGVVGGTVLLFLMAGLIEGFFRQLVTSLTMRYALAIGTALLWTAYFVLVDRDGGSSEEPAP